MVGGAGVLAASGAFVVALVVAAAFVSSVLVLAAVLSLHPVSARADAAPSRHSAVFTLVLFIAIIFMYVLPLVEV